MANSTFLCIDLKSFYASVECAERSLDPLTTNLVVADASRTNKTICLAVSPSLKALGVSSRPRLFEVIQTVNRLNQDRLRRIPNHQFEGESSDADELRENPRLKISFVVAIPQMAHYMKCSTEIYKIYLKYIAPEDIHVYSIDEVFMDLTHYLKSYGCGPRELAMRMIQNVLRETGITATAGIGTNMYLAKVAMDIVAKHIPADADGVRIAALDEISYREKLWNHRPLTDFWRVGRGYARKLAAKGLHTMGDIARCSIGAADDYYNEDLLYSMFGVNAELLIDHAWGWEPCTMEAVKSYKPENSSIASGQVLHCAYESKMARIVLFEMADALALDLVSRGMVTEQLVLTVGYDIENLSDPERAAQYKGEIKIDFYGRAVPKSAHGTYHLPSQTSSAKLITDGTMALYDHIVDEKLLVRRLNLGAVNVVSEESVRNSDQGEQLNLFGAMGNEGAEESSQKREHDIQDAMLAIKQKFGKNSIVKGVNLEEGATGMERNNQVGGHKA